MVLCLNHLGDVAQPTAGRLDSHLYSNPGHYDRNGMVEQYAIPLDGQALYVYGSYYRLLRLLDLRLAPIRNELFVSYRRHIVIQPAATLAVLEELQSQNLSTISILDCQAESAELPW